MTVKDKLRLSLLTTMVCFCISFSLPNYSSQAEQNTQKTAQVIREHYLDFYYWMEALSRAPLMLVEPFCSANSAPLTADDLKRIYNLSFTASHLVDPVYFSLRNAYYSSNFQNGTAFDINTLDANIVHQHELYLGKLHDMHLRMSPYFNNEHQVGKTFAQFNEEILIPAYEESYQAYKQWMLQYAPEEKPYDPTLGKKRAQQWIRFEIADQLLKAITRVTDSIESLREGNICSCPDLKHPSADDIYAIESLKNIAEKYIEHPLLQELMPDVFDDFKNLIAIKLQEEYVTEYLERVEYYDLRYLFKVQERLRDVVNKEEPPYGMAYYPVRFSSDTSLEKTGLNLHQFSRLPLESLETLKADISTRREKIANRAVLPETVLRELGINIQ